MVSELSCFEEDCPPVGTGLVVSVPAKEKLQFKLRCPIAEVPKEMIRDICKQQINQESEKIHGKWKPYCLCLSLIPIQENGLVAY